MRAVQILAGACLLTHAEFGLAHYQQDSFFPSPNATGSGDWKDAFIQAQSLTAKMTLEEKLFMVTGVEGPCVGNIPEIPRLGFKGLCLQDGPLAIKQVSYASTFPAGVSAAATWDKKLMHQRGVELGQEFFAKGAHIMLGPVAGPLGRSPFGGRNWESFGPDPYLAGVAMEETIRGVQSQGVQACPKHYIANEQETQRNPSSNEDGVTIEALSSNVDDRTMHEVYLWPFANAVRAGTSSIMCAYNRINQTYACENSKALNGLLKTELGFRGYVLSDWGGTHSGLNSILSGLDMDMPGPLAGSGASEDIESWFGRNITTMINNGSLEATRLDDMVHRVLTPYYFLRQDRESFPTIDRDTSQITAGVTGDVYPDFKDPFNLSPPDDMNRDVRADHAQLIREMGAASTVLLKNVAGTLPLHSPKRIGVFGNDAGAPSGGPFVVDAPIGVMATGSNGGGTGSGRIQDLVSPLEAIRDRSPHSYIQSVLDNDVLTSENLEGIYPAPDVCIVFLKQFATEGEDHSLELDYDATNVVETVTSSGSCPNTVVVMHNPGPVVLPWADNDNVTAILAAHYPGEQAGNSLADILFGDVSPSGKLPYTIAYSEKDYNTPIVNLTDVTDPNGWQLDFTEGLMIDYRHFDHAAVAPRYEFGFGLSYTTFTLSNLHIRRTSPTGKSQLQAYPPESGNPGIPQPGGHPSLWEVVASVSVAVHNTGETTGAAVPQLYLSFPTTSPAELTTANTPPKVLRGFEKIMLEPGQREVVTFNLTRRDVSFWDAVAQEWKIPRGDFGVWAGQSSRDEEFLTDVLRLREE
ncbi:beta-glucosidase [Aspergillus lucknowensis]|uniref:Probable beta-glucosidase G n=1 Tax=Aspergillus lucknowensis TaxID=176173 RepID=A0ABR4L984_9EURO